MHRLFIAVDFPDDVKEHLANLCHGITGARWVSKDQSHLTIRFIGEVDDAAFSDIAEVLTDVAVSRFYLSLKGVGYFPPRGRPNVLWAGMEKNDELLLLRDMIERQLSQTGIAPEQRKFAPHITLARLSLHTPLRRVTEFLSANGLFRIDAIPITEFHLYSSLLTSSGPIHKKEETYALL